MDRLESSFVLNSVRGGGIVGDAKTDREVVSEKSSSTKFWDCIGAAYDQQERRTGAA